MEEQKWADPQQDEREADEADEDSGGSNEGEGGGADSGGYSGGGSNSNNGNGDSGDSGGNGGSGGSNNEGNEAEGGAESADSGNNGGGGDSSGRDSSNTDGNGGDHSNGNGGGSGSNGNGGSGGSSGNGPLSSFTSSSSARRAEGERADQDDEPSPPSSNEEAQVPASPQPPARSKTASRGRASASRDQSSRPGMSFTWASSASSDILQLPQGAAPAAGNNSSSSSSFARAAAVATRGFGQHDDPIASAITAQRRRATQLSMGASAGPAPAVGTNQGPVVAAGALQRHAHQSAQPAAQLGAQLLSTQQAPVRTAGTTDALQAPRQGPPAVSSPSLGLSSSSTGEGNGGGSGRPQTARSSHPPPPLLTLPAQLPAQGLPPARGMTTTTAPTMTASVQQPRIAGAIAASRASRGGMIDTGAAQVQTAAGSATTGGATAPLTWQQLVSVSRAATPSTSTTAPSPASTVSGPASAASVDAQQRQQQTLIRLLEQLAGGRIRDQHPQQQQMLMQQQQQEPPQQQQQLLRDREQQLALARLLRFPTPSEERKQDEPADAAIPAVPQLVSGVGTVRGAHHQQPVQPQGQGVQPEVAARGAPAILSHAGLSNPPIAAPPLRLQTDTSSNPLVNMLSAIVRQLQPQPQPPSQQQPPLQQSRQAPQALLQSSLSALQNSQATQQQQHVPTASSPSTNPGMPPLMLPGQRLTSTGGPAQQHLGTTAVTTTTPGVNELVQLITNIAQLQHQQQQQHQQQEQQHQALNSALAQFLLQSSQPASTAASTSSLPAILRQVQNNPAALGASSAFAATATAASGNASVSGQLSVTGGASMQSGATSAGASSASMPPAKAQGGSGGGGDDPHDDEGGDDEDEDSELDEEAKYEQFVQNLPEMNRKRRLYRHEPFPERLYRMLNELEKKGQREIVTFTPSGNAFEVRDPQRYEKEIGPQYFKHKNYASFRRQLSMYGFQRIESGPEVGGFEHQLFRRGRPELLPKILRLSELEEAQEAALWPEGRREVSTSTRATSSSRKRKSSGKGAGRRQDGNNDDQGSNNDAEEHKKRPAKKR